MRALLRRAILLMVILSIGSAGQTVPAKAAGPGRPQAKSVVTIILEIQPPKQPVCVGKDRSVVVHARADTDILRRNGKAFHVKDEPQNGVTVESAVTNPDIGHLSPKKLVTGEEFLDDPGESVFIFTAEKAGTTILQFTPIYAGKKGQKEEIAIKVVDCEFKVNMNVTDIDSRDGVTIWTTGHLETKITGDSDALEGSGSFAFDSGFTGPPCTITYSEFENATTIKGHIDDNDQLVLNFQYQPGQITSQATCPDSSRSASQAIDLTNMGIASATFPDTGGTQAIRFTYAGSDFAPGTMIINVEPVEAGG